VRPNGRIAVKPALAHPARPTCQVMRSEAGHSMRLRQVVQSLSTPPLTLCCSMRAASAHREPIFFRVLTDAGLNPFTLNPTRIETETSFHESHTNDVAVASVHFSISEARWFRLQDVEMPLLLDASLCLLFGFLVALSQASSHVWVHREGTAKGRRQQWLRVHLYGRYRLGTPCLCHPQQLLDSEFTGGLVRHANRSSGVGESRSGFFRWRIVRFAAWRRALLGLRRKSC